MQTEEGREGREEVEAEEEWVRVITMLLLYSNQAIRVCLGSTATVEFSGTFDAINK